MFIHGSDLSSVSVVDDKKFILKKVGIDENATHCLRREVETLQYLKDRGLDFGYVKHEPDFSSLTLRRHGTHDLSDANVDHDRRQMLSILSEASMQLQSCTAKASSTETSNRETSCSSEAATCTDFQASLILV